MNGYARLKTHLHFNPPTPFFFSPMMSINFARLSTFTSHSWDLAIIAPELLCLKSKKHDGSLICYYHTVRPGHVYE